MRIGIFGYGNLGRGVELAARNNADAQLVCVFTRRNPGDVQTQTGIEVRSAAETDAFREKIDVLIVCAGSSGDVTKLTPLLAERFHVADSFDAHARIPAHYRAVDRAALRTGHLALISGGWDPGLFSIARLYASAVMPAGQCRTFWGPGVSQGHSEAIRGIPGVLDARAYTIPDSAALDAFRSGEDVSARRLHRRKCFVAIEEGADASEIERAIKQMPGYFEGCETSVEFVCAEELRAAHSALPHGGLVACRGATGLNGQNRVNIETSLRADSNPEFTGNVLIALARAVYRMSKRGDTGARTVFDVCPADLSPMDPEALRAEYL